MGRPVRVNRSFRTFLADAATGEPRMVQQGVVDKLTAVMVAQATASALYARTQDPDGHGQAVEVPMMDSALWFLWPDCMYNHVLMDPQIPKIADVVEHARLRKTRDGYLMVQLVGQDEYDGMCRALGRVDMIDDPRFNSPTARYNHLRELNTVFAEDFARFNTDEIHARLMEEDVPVARIRTRDEVLEDPQVRARGIVETVKDATGADMRRVKHPINFGGTPGDARRPAPLLGEQTAEILREAGYAEEAIHQLLQSGVARQN